MGLLEMSIILFIVITIGQYLVAWAAYFEKRYTYVMNFEYFNDFFSDIYTKFNRFIFAKRVQTPINIFRNKS